MRLDTAHTEKVYTEAELEQRIVEAGFAAEPLVQALEEIAALASHRNRCCPTNPAKGIARKALGQS